MGAVCCNVQNNLSKMKEDQLLKFLLSQFNPTLFSAPLGQINDSDQLQIQNCNWPQKQIKQISGCRQVRQDSNQFYSCLIYTLLQRIYSGQQQDKIDIIVIALSFQWQLSYNNKLVIKNGCKFAENFIEIASQITENKLLDYYYTDLSRKFPFYLLCMIFIRNWVKNMADVRQQGSNNSQILDWTIPFDLQQEELLIIIAETLHMQLMIYHIETNETKLYGKQSSTNCLSVFIFHNQEVSIGLTEAYFMNSIPSRFIYNLYQVTSQARKVNLEQQQFVSLDLDCLQLKDDYQLNDQMFSRMKLKGFKRVRGDGNCFYTTIVFQYLELIITSFNEAQFKQFLEELNLIQFKLAHSTINFMSQELQNYLKQMFLSIIYEIRGSSDKRGKLESEFSNNQSIFYALSIIYIKNLLFYFSELNEEHKLLLGAEAQQQMLQWEEETDNIQVVLVILAEYLSLKIDFYYIDPDSKTVDLQQYQNTMHNWNLYIIFSPGHYCIGLPITNKKAK